MSLFVGHDHPATKPYFDDAETKVREPNDMNNFRNIIMIGLLAVFFAGYGLSWAYQSLYKEPRQRLGTQITQHRQGIETGRRNIALMRQFSGQNLFLYSRSMPRIVNEVRSQYSFWFLELLKYCDVRDSDVKSDAPTRTAFNGWNYRFHIRGTCSLDQLSRLLFEFYSIPFLHRITALSIAPVEGKEGQIVLSMTVDALSVPPRDPSDPYPLSNQLPQFSGMQPGQFRRLVGNDLPQYRVIADRNLLQAAKGGVDRADYAFVTAVNRIGDRTEIWITVRTDDTVVKAVQGDPVRVGSFRAKLVDIRENDVVFERDGMRWLLTLGDCLNQAFALPPETVVGIPESSL